MSVEHTEVKGNKVIVLKRNEMDAFPLRLGKIKAKLIVENFEAIKEFVEGK